MTPFKGVKVGDLIEVETASESGIAVVDHVDDNGVHYRPAPASWQQRTLRQPLKARQIKTVFRRLNR